MRPVATAAAKALLVWPEKKDRRVSAGQGTTDCSDSQKCAAGLERWVRCLTKAFTEIVIAVASAMTGRSRLHLWGRSVAASNPTGVKRLAMRVVELTWSRSRRLARLRRPAASVRIFVSKPLTSFAAAGPAGGVLSNSPALKKRAAAEPARIASAARRGRATRIG